MTKLSRKQLDTEKFGHYINNLWSAFTLMDTKEDVRLLFKDLFTHTEYKMFAKRLEIARRLLQKENYLDIQKNLKVTSNTISRINNILVEKGEGLKKVHEKLERLEKKYFDRKREIIKNLENPFRNKVHQKTVLGEALKVGAVVLGNTVKKKLKEDTVKNQLPV